MKPVSVTTPCSLIETAIWAISARLRAAQAPCAGRSSTAADNYAPALARNGRW